MSAADRGARAGAWAVAVAVAAVAAWALLRETFVAQTQTYDTMLYARSLWGVAHGDLHNPVYGTHVFGVHAQLGLLPLAPLVALMPAAAALIAAQCAALAATLGMVGVAFARALDPQRPAAAAAAGAALAALSPLVLNPFFFDARPDLLAVPLLTAGLLRMERRRAVDGGVAAWLLAGVLMREEFAAVAAFALLLLPPGVDDRLGRPRRVALAALALAWFGTYWFVVRPALGGAGDRADQAASDLLGGEGAWGYRAAVVALVLAAGGGLALRGWRWAGAAIPGIGLTLLVSKLGMGALSFQYPMFAAPGLLVAMVAGARGLSAVPAPRRRAAWGAIALIAAGAYVAAGAGPGGARFAADYVRAGSDPVVDTELAALLGARATLDQVPPDAGLLAPTMIGAAYADRASIWSAESLTAQLGAGAPPDDLAWAMLTAPEFSSLGRRLAGLHGFELVAWSPAWALLAAPSVDVGALPLSGVFPGVACEAPLVAWPAAGLAACDPVVDTAGLRVVVVRTGPAAPALDGVPVALQWRSEAGATWVTVLNGLVAVASLPLGVPVRAIADTGGAGGTLALVDARGRAIPAMLPGGGAPVEAAPIR